MILSHNGLFNIIIYKYIIVNKEGQRKNGRISSVCFCLNFLVFITDLIKTAIVFYSRSILVFKEKRQMFEIDDIVTLCGVAFGKNSHFSYDFRTRLFEKPFKSFKRFAR